MRSSSYEVSTLAGQYGVPPDVDQIEEIENPDPSDQTDRSVLLFILTFSVGL